MTRWCDAPAPKCGGLTCAGEDNVTETETRTVTLQPLPPTWTPWQWDAPWSSWLPWKGDVNASAVPIPAHGAEPSCALSLASLRWRRRIRTCVSANDTCSREQCAGDSTATAFEWRLDDTDLKSDLSNATGGGREETNGTLAAANTTVLAMAPECCAINGSWVTEAVGQWSSWRYGAAGSLSAPNCSLNASLAQPRSRQRWVSRTCVSRLPICGNAACNGAALLNVSETQTAYIPPRDDRGWGNWTVHAWSAWQEVVGSECGQQTVRLRRRALERACLNPTCAPPCIGNAMAEDTEEEVSFWLLILDWGDVSRLAGGWIGAMLKLGE